MHSFWWAILVLIWAVLVGTARADTVYLTNGQAIWGTDAYEEGDSVVVVRPGGNLTFPKSQVSRIERTRSSLPPFYSPPAAPPAEGAPPAAPGAPGTAGAPGTQPTPSMPPGGPPAPAPPSGESATQLPPPPPPPPPPGTGTVR